MAIVIYFSETADTAAGLFMNDPSGGDRKAVVAADMTNLLTDFMLVSKMTYDVRNGVVLITGAANGIGAELVRAMLKEGAKHVAILDVAQAAGIAFQNEMNLKYGPGKTKFYYCDVTKDDQLFGAFTSTIDAYGSIDLVVNNAGVCNDSPSVYKKQIEINVTGVVTSTLKAVELMRVDNGGEGGTVINIASVAALSPSPMIPIYAATKSAVLHFSNCIGSEEYYLKTRVRVMTMCYGPTDTAIITKGKLGSIDKRDENELVDFFEAIPTQSAESAAVSLMEAYKRGKTASVWLSIIDEPAEDITGNMTKAYQLITPKRGLEIEY